MAPSARPLGFSRRHRFTVQGAFGAVLRAPRKIRGRQAVIHIAQAPASESRLGIALTRRLVPSAVVRNRLKRVIREAFRRHPVKARGLDCVLTLRAAPRASEEAALLAEVRGFFDQLCPG